jgi:tartrate-resistant acid phosphatase type 5
MLTDNMIAIFRITQRAIWVKCTTVIFVLLLAGCSFSPPLPLPTATLLPSPLPSDTLAPTPVPSETPSLTPDQPTATSAATGIPSETPLLPIPTETPIPQIVRFAVIGDYGSGSQAEADVANLVKSWNPDLIITTGDNNYPDGAANTIDSNTGQFYHEYIAPYQGSFGEGAQENRFFPSLGNHDWNTAQAQPHLEYFTLPGNERYYDFTWGPVHFFAIDSDSREPDGVGRSSEQAIWTQTRLEGSPSPWKIVYFHHPAYSSGLHGSVDWMQWPFAEWGADAVLSGHDHTYERISREGITYFVNGLGGMSQYLFIGAVDGSQVRYNRDYGAMLVEASENTIRFQFINRMNEVVDAFELSR